MASQPTYKSWQCPPQVASEEAIVSFVNDLTGEGISWLRSQRCFRDYRKALDTISGMDTQPTQAAAYRSRLNTNRLKRNIREVVSVLSRLRPFWGYSTDNKGYINQAALMNMITRFWYLDTFVDESVKKALQYAAGTGRGWMHPLYRRNNAGTGKGDIIIETFGAPCVLPSQLPSNGDWQRAYAVTILDEWPIYEAHGIFPQFQERLVPSSNKFWYQNDNIRTSAYGNIWTRMFRRSPNNEPTLPDKLIPIRKTYIVDLSLNTTDKPIPMGEPGSSWFYEVPYIGQEIAAGNDPNGRPLTRKADENDARIYPYRRLIMSSDKVRLYDGPAFDWHGQFPGVSFCPDEWPWEPIGFSMVHDGYEINECIKEIERGVMDMLRAKMNPSLMFDQNAVPMKQMRKFDPFKPNDRIGFDGMAGDGTIAKTPMDAEFYRIDPNLAAFYEAFKEGLDSQMMVDQAVNLAKARTVGSVDNLEKLMEMQGPIIAGMSRSMEVPLRDLGNMVKYNILQYYTTSRVMRIVGVDNVPRETVDFDPQSLVPSHVKGENEEVPSPTPKTKRARAFAENLVFSVQPNSLHEYQQMEYRLGLIQLMKAGAKISSQTLADAWNVQDYGKFEGRTEIERWMSEKELELQFAVRGEVMKQSMEMGAAAQSLMQPPGSAQPGKQPEGRPTVGMDSPRLVSKDGGTRSTITQVR